MPAREVTGDLFQIDTIAIGHGVNCTGVMGSGIAPLFRTRWPDMYEAYRHACLTKEITVGGLFPYKTDDGRVILNLASQNQPGANAELSAIRASLMKAVLYCEREDLTEFAIPRIGAGIGGLNWDEVKATVVEVGNMTDVDIIIVSLPQ